MKMVDLTEVDKLYKDCHVEVLENKSIRTSLNIGTMNNKLNCDYSFMNRDTVSLKCCSSLVLDKSEGC